MPRFSSFASFSLGSGQHANNGWAVVIPAHVSLRWLRLVLLDGHTKAWEAHVDKITSVHMFIAY